LSAHETSAGVPGGIYTREAGERTLNRLLGQARGLLDAGFTVLVDATFIRREWRAPFEDLAGELTLPWFIAAAEAPPEVLRERVARRMTEGRDASEAGLDVLEAQIASLEPFTESELPHVLHLRDGVGKALNLVRTARS
jgi:predicted kinase